MNPAYSRRRSADRASRFGGLLFAAAAIIFAAGSAGAPGPENGGAVALPEVRFVPAQSSVQEATRNILGQIAGLLAGGDFEGAIAGFDRIPAADAASSAIRALKASVFLSAGRTREARAQIREILNAEPDNVDALYVLASIEDAEGKSREYRQTLERIINLAPAHLDTLISLGNLQLRGNSWRTAATWFDRALAVDPRSGDALVGRAEAYRRMNAPERAEQLLTRAIEIYPGWATPYTERAQLRRYHGDYNAAHSDLVRAKQISPGDYWVACDLGSILLALDRKTEALAEYTRAAGLEPEQFLAWVYIAGLRDDLGDPDGAEHAYVTLARLKPDYHYAFEGIGMHRMRRKQWAEARDAFREAWNRAQDEWSYALLAAACWMKAERIQAPRDFLNTALRRLTRDTLPWYVMRLYTDLSGEADLASRIEQERNIVIRARMIFFLALYYDARGNTAIANSYFLVVKELDQKAIPEWRLNEWICAERGLRVDR